MVYTESELNQMKKPDLIKLVIEYQSMHKQLDELSQKIMNLEDKVDEMQALNLVSTNTSSLLVKRVKSLEADLLKSQQYSRRECIDVSGIPSTVKDEDIEGEVCRILDNVGISLDADKDIQACHRYGRNTTVIVKLSNRKSVKKILGIKTQLPDDIFVSESLCPRNKARRGGCNRLKKANLISKIATRNGMVRYKVSDTSDYVDIEHEDDLTSAFPDFKFDF